MYRRSFFCLLIVLSTLIQPGNLSAQQIIRGPYLQKPTPNSIVIRWRTDIPVTGRVYYGNSPANQPNYVDENTAVTEHSVEITGLTPFTRYYYAVGTPSQILSGPDSNHYFTTFPQPGTVQPIRAWVIGDFGKGNEAQKRVRDAYLRQTTDKHTDVWLWLGDNAYDDGTDQEYQTKVFDSVNAYYHIMKYLPFLPCPGNHDYNSVCPVPCNQDPATHTGPYYDIIDVPVNGEAGGVPSGTEAFYSFDYGNVHFISLNSELGSLNPSYDWIGANPLGSFNGSPMTQWLEADLQANDKPWVIVFWHQAPYTKGSHDSDDAFELYMKAMREHFNPIVERYGVDLVITGHSHVYERSYLINGHYGTSSDWDPSTMLVDGGSGYDSLGEAYVKYINGPDANKGTVYMVVGNSGASENNPALNHPVMFFGYGGDNEAGSVVLDISGNKLESWYIRHDGKILDRWTMYKIDTASTGLPAVFQSPLQVVPNPFYEETTIRFTVEKPGKFTLSAYDLTGRKVAEFFNGTLTAGMHRLPFHAGKFNLRKGVYVLKLSDGNQVLSHQVVKYR